MITKTTHTNGIVYLFVSGLDHIKITVYDKLADGQSPGSIESNLASEDADPRFNAAIDGLEATLLALACEGFDLSGESGHKAVQSALDAIARLD